MQQHVCRPAVACRPRVTIRVTVRESPHASYRPQWAGAAADAGDTLGFPVVHWFFTALLIAASAGTVGFTGYLLRRLFTTEPDVPAAVPTLEPTP